ncbi:MAG: hypothetical protein DRP45_05735, partial [Candidatus Zixiibacteriota bacterium]
MTDEKDMDQSADSGLPEGKEQAAESPEEVSDSGAKAAESPSVEEEPAVATAEENEAGEDASSDADGGDLADVSGEPSDEDFKVVNEDDAPEEDAEAAMLKMLEDLPEEDNQASPDEINFGSASVSEAEFQHLQEPAGSNKPQNIELLMDVDLPISIELGRAKMTVADILALGPGSVVELNKLAGEPVDLLV